MKKLFLIAALIITGFIFQIKAQDYYDRGYDNSYNSGGYDNDGFGYFYSSLSPYGSWVEFGDGVYGWRPVHMRNSWAPYAEGRWIWTSDGWYWDSYEPFGYIVYHYGRWYNDSYYGWVWIPDYQWAPAWVEWRYDNDYVGWAPLPPYAVFSISIGIHFTHSYYTPYAQWHFVKYHYFCDPYVVNYYVAPQYKYRIYSKTKYRNDYGYRNGRVVNRGIDVSIIRDRGKVDIRERKIRTVSNLRDINDRNRITNDEIRTFIPEKKNFTGAKVRDVKIERTDRKTSLETSKLDFGRIKTERKTPVTKKVETRNDKVIQKDANKDVRIQRNTTKENVNQSKRTEEKKVVPDTRIKTGQRKEVKTPVKKEPVRKETRTNTSVRNIPLQNTDKKNNDQRIMKQNEPRKDTRTFNPPTQKRTEVKVNRNQVPSRSTGNNPNIQRQRDNGSKTEVKRETNNKGRR